MIFKGATISLFVAATALILLACSEQKEYPPPKTAEQIRIKELADEKFLREYKAEQATIESELMKASEKKLRSLYITCKEEILKLAKEQNISNFGFFLVDEHSADTYQATAYISGSGSTSSTDERLKTFLNRRQNKSPDLFFALNLSYAIMFTRDTLSGPMKEPKGYSCSLKPGLIVEAN
ncbi:hypothetical protein [Aquabacterium sp.]|uniref:hypothetical protein n=1 Tax=Aquabacterium sp. TaxID=1872578 RepID=UPI0024877AFF|nr:hypothetical protein [Aquabacterium sp.]MDI1259368.1 hypothetical protein [Aquabacterium sp.]